jgi:hypothetical protein
MPHPLETAVENMANSWLLCDCIFAFYRVLDAKPLRQQDRDSLSMVKETLDQVLAPQYIFTPKERRALTMLLLEGSEDRYRLLQKTLQATLDEKPISTEVLQAAQDYLIFLQESILVNSREIRGGCF